MPVVRSNSRLLYPREAPAMAAMVSSLMGARPRFVCRMTPVALMTGRSAGRSNASTCATTAAIIPSDDGIVSPLPARTPAR